jgi:hypothetical protein
LTDREKYHRLTEPGWQPCAYTIVNGKRWQPFEPPPRDEPPPDWRTGTVRTFLSATRTGFVQPDGLGRHHTIYFLATTLELTVGARVRFTLRDDPRPTGKQVVDRMELTE